MRNHSKTSSLEIGAVMKSVFLVLFASSLTSAQFRCDYKYLPEGHGWYKLHEIPQEREFAKEICRLEGSVLVTPTLDVLSYLQRSLNKKIEANEVVQEMDVILKNGIHTDFKTVYLYKDIKDRKQVQEFQNTVPKNLIVEEKIIIMHRNGSNEHIDLFMRLPFVCHKRAGPIVRLNECGTEDDEYTLEPRTGKCYKFHRMRNHWTRAQHICQVEGGNLAVINSDVESAVIQDIFNNSPPDSIPGWAWVDSAFLGFTKNIIYGWFTVEGTTLKNAGFDKWNEGEPNNANGDEYCGSVGRNGLLYDDPCERELPFICEKNRESLTECIDNDEDNRKSMIRSLFKNNIVN